MVHLPLPVILDAPRKKPRFWSWVIRTDTRSISAEERAIPTYAKGLPQVKLGIGIWTHYDKPDKKGIMMIGSKWSTVGDIDGYEYETEGKVYVNTGSAKVVNLYARVRAYKVTDDKGTREYSAWSDVSQALEYE